MKFTIFLITTLFLCFCACNEPFDIYPQQPPLKSCILSRTATYASLPDGSTALFNISGAFQLTNQLFTYTNHTWKSENALQWEDQEGNCYLTAIYPALNEYSYQTLYINNQLTDLLIAQDTLISGNDIELTFKHLFSSLTIQLNEIIKAEIKNIKLSIPQIVSWVDPINGNYTLEINEYSVTELPDNNGTYTFIIPPMEDAILTLQLTLSDETTYTHVLSPYTFRSGHSYMCNVIKEDERPGIRTAEDLIAFSLLYNKQSYTGDKTLADFGEEIDGQTVYRLLNDLTLTEEQSKRILPIGYYESLPFNQVFDGEGHSIYHLTLPDKSIFSKVYSSYSGLFGFIGAGGTVKDLHLKHAKTIEDPVCTRIGFIATQNEGTIMNCSVTNSIIHNGTNDASGFICGQLSSSGYIINCYATNDTIATSNSHRVGGIAGYANGTILNCYTSDNYFKLNSNDLKAGGIAGGSSSSLLLTIANCYNHHIGSSPLYPLMETAKKVYVNNFFYNSSTPYNTANSSNITKENIYQYDSLFQVDGTDITTLLNAWITNTGNTNYPNISFKSWTIKDGNVNFE